MKISIKKRIELDTLIGHSDWDGCYIILKEPSFQEIKAFVKGEADISKREKYIRSELARLNVTDHDIEYAAKLENELSDSSTKVLDLMTDFVRSRFIQGVGFDEETKSKQDLKAEDMEQFSAAIITQIFKTLTGQVEKKS